MRQISVHRPAMMRVSVALILVGILSLLAAPLATAQSSRDDGGAPDATLASRRDGQSDPPTCPAGFQLTADALTCFDYPTNVTTQGLVFCEVGYLSESGALCLAEAVFVTQVPTSRTEVIDATLTPNAPTVFCPTSWELDPELGLCITRAVNEAPRVIETGDTYCPVGSPADFGTICIIEESGLVTTPGLYLPPIPSTAAIAATCPDGTDPTVVQNGLCKVTDSAPLPPPCFDDEVTVIIDPASENPETVCFLALPQIPGTAGIAGSPATCEGQPTTLPADECVTLSPSISQTPAVVNDGPPITTCNEGLWFDAEAGLCFPVSVPTTIQNPDTVTCPLGYDGPTPDLKCTRTILTAQPDAPACSSGELREIQDDIETPGEFVCVLANEPVAPPPVFSVRCDQGQYDPDSDLCLLAPDFGSKSGSIAVPTATPTPSPPPEVPSVPVTATLPLIVTAVGDQADAPPTWVFQIRSNCLPDGAEVEVPTIDTFGAQAFVEFPIDEASIDGAPCTYTVTGVPYLDWATSLPADGITFTPLETGVPLIFVTVTQPGAGQIEISNFTASTGETPLPASLEFTISGICLAEPMTVTADTGGVDGYSGTIASVPAVDGVENSCVYQVEVGPVPGFDSIMNPIEVVMYGAFGNANFLHFPSNLEGGAITITKSSLGDPATAPQDWEFTVSSLCGGDPIDVTIPAAPTFIEEVSVTITGLELACEYEVIEASVDGYLEPHAQDIFLAENYPIVELHFTNRHLSSVTRGIHIAKTVLGAVDGEIFTLSITSNCLVDTMLIDVEISDMSSGEFIPGLAVGDAAGEACVYTIDLAEPTGDLAEPTGYDVVAGALPITVDLLASQTNDGFVNVSVDKASDGYTPPLIVSKFALGDPANAPATFELLVSSPCLSQPITVSLPSDEAFQDGAQEILNDLPTVTADDDLCEYTVTEPDHDGYAAIEPDPVVLNDPYGTHTGVINIESGLAIGAVVIRKAAFGDPTNAPEFWEFTISSPCFDPITVDIPSGPTFDGYHQTDIGELPLVDMHGFCEVTVTESPVDGFAQSLPITQSFEDGYSFGLIVGTFTKSEAGQGLTSDLTILKYGFEIAEIPDTLRLVIDSDCLDAPIVAEVDGADVANGELDLRIPGLPIEVGAELCVYAVTPVAAEGVEHLLDLNALDGTLTPNGGLVVIMKAPTGTFGEDAITPLPHAPLPHAPLPQAPLPPIAPSPEPTPAPSQTPTSSITPAPVSSAPSPIVGVVSTPASSSPVTVASANFGGSAPTTPASMLGGVSYTTPSASTPTAKPLAHTGSEARYLTVFGLAMIMLGAILMLLSRREVHPDPFA